MDLWLYQYGRAIIAGCLLAGIFVLLCIAARAIQRLKRLYMLDEPSNPILQDESL